MGPSHGATKLSKQKEKLNLCGKTAIDKSAWIKAWLMFLIQKKLLCLQRMMFTMMFASTK